VATHKSAEKRARQAERRRVRNRNQRSRLRTAVRQARSALAEEGEGVAEAIRQAEGLLRRAASKGLIPRQRASRQIARLARAANRKS
jgi:small subunit ribosomal protein S20